MLPTIMEIVDTSVANVALPHMQGSLNAGTDEVTWVLTSYLVSNAVVLPMTGWLSRVFGRKRFLITCIILFTIASFLCFESRDIISPANLPQGLKSLFKESYLAALFSVNLAI